VNNLAIRRAAEELKVARDYDQVRRILIGAFASNDFDSFELKLEPLPEELVAFATAKPSLMSFRWIKPAPPKPLDDSALWTIALDLVSSANRRCGTLFVHRRYSQRALQLDINLMTFSFPTVLADALDRALVHSAQIIALPGQDEPLIAAQAG